MNENEKYIKKNYLTSNRKNNYKITSFKNVKSFPILEENNYLKIMI